MSRYHTHIEVDAIEDVPVTVNYLHVPFRAGHTDGPYGPKLEPDEPEHIEIESVETDDGQTIELTSEQETAMEEQIGEWLQGYYDEPERREFRYDA